MLRNERLSSYRELGFTLHVLCWQDKYKQCYDDQRSHYKTLLKVFHETYPDAKQLLAK